MMIFTKEYIINVENLNRVDELNSKLRELFVDKIVKGLKEILAKNDAEGGNLETLFIESLKAFKGYDVDTCFTHLTFLISYYEENNIDKFESIDFNLQVVTFYEYMKSIDKISFFHISRVITYISDFYIGEELFKNIIIDLNNKKDYYLDGTSIEYFKMYMEELLLESETFRNWMALNNTLVEFLK